MPEPINQAVEQTAVAAANKITAAGSVTAVAPSAYFSSGFAEALATPGPEIVNLCAIIGATVAVIGGCVSITLQILSYRKKARSYE